MPFDRKRTRTIGRGTLAVNWFFQRVLRVNGRCPHSVHFTSRVSFPQNLEFTGDATEVEALVCLASSIGCYIQARNGLIIDRSVRFAPGVRLISANHEAADRAKFDSAAPIRIGRNVWIGANAVILPGVEIGENTIVGAGSVVSRSLPPDVVAVGVPCRPVKALPGS